MRAFHSDPEIKQKYLERVRIHRAADQIVHGEYWEDGKGCAVGCTIHSAQHDRYETELGIPAELAHLEDNFFESLPNGVSMEWPEKFLDAIPVGADLSMVVPHFLYWLLADETEGVIRHADEKRFPRCHAAIARVAKLFQKLVNGEVIPRETWAEARRDAADAAAAYAAYAAAASAAADAAADAAAAYAADAAAAYAAYAADAAAAYAAYAAAYAAARQHRVAWEEARIRARVRQSEKILELLRAAPVVPEAVEVTGGRP